MYGFGGEPFMINDLVMIAHGGYMNIGVITHISETSFTTREMMGWYSQNRTTGEIRGNRRDGGIMITEKVRPSHYAFKVFPLAPHYKNSQIGQLFCDSYRKKYKVDLNAI